MDGKSESLIKVTAVEDCRVDTAAHLTRRFVVTVFGSMSLLETMITKVALR